MCYYIPIAGTKSSPIPPATRQSEVGYSSLSLVVTVSSCSVPVLTAWATGLLPPGLEIWGTLWWLWPWAHVTERRAPRADVPGEPAGSAPLRGVGLYLYLKRWKMYMIWRETRVWTLDFFFFFLIVIYLAALGLSCGTRDPQSLLWRVGSSSPTGVWTQAPCIGSTILSHCPPGESLEPTL